MKSKLFILIVLFFLCFSVGNIFAVDGLNLVISPLPISLFASPESTVSAQIKLKNGGDTPETLHAGLMKFTAYGDEGKPRLTDREKGDDYFDWLTFSENDFVLNPGQWKTITVNINVPKEASFGYYYAVTFSRKEDEENNDQKSNKIVGATATLILLEVQVQNAIRDVEVLEFYTSQKIYEFLPATFFVKLKNSGNVHLAPRGNIFIDSIGKKDIAILNINDLKGNVLPGSNRIFETKWGDGFPMYTQQTKNNTVVTDNEGREKLKLKWDFTQIQKIRFGKYTAHMLLVYDDGKRDIPIEGELNFWVIPWRIVLVLLVVSFIIVFGVYSTIKLLIVKLGKK